MRPLLIGVTAVLVLASVGGGTAHAGYGDRGPIVAHGESPAGLEWTIRAAHQRQFNAINVDFDVASSTENYGWGLQFQPPVPDESFIAISGGDLGPANEGDISGITSRDVVALRVRMNEGSPLAIDPQLAPKRVRERHAWARHMRFFDAFFADGFDPRGIRAFDAEGNVVGHSRSHHGAFDSWG